MLLLDTEPATLRFLLLLMYTKIAKARARAAMNPPMAIPTITPGESFLLSVEGSELADEEAAEEEDVAVVLWLEAGLVPVAVVWDRRDAGVTIAVEVNTRLITLMMVWGTPGEIEVMFCPVVQLQVPDRTSASQQK
jgi:hypothetical protein